MSDSVAQHQVQGARDKIITRIASKGPLAVRATIKPSRLETKGKAKAWLANSLGSSEARVRATLTRDILRKDKDMVNRAMVNRRMANQVMDSQCTVKVVTEVIHHKAMVAVTVGIQPSNHREEVGEAWALWAELRLDWEGVCSEARC